MPRVKRGTIAQKRRRSILSRAKGYMHGRSKKERLANEALLHAGRNAFRDRRAKKGVFRRLWTVKINAAIRSITGSSYSSLINSLKKEGAELDRKTLATLAEKSPEVFKRLAEKINK